jgi:EpsI family protein
VLPVDPRASAQLLRTYRNGDRTLWISVSYYPLQSEGHGPALELLYPNRGWSVLSARTIRIPLREPGAQSIPANLVLIREGGQGLAILYWYQVQGHSIASDHWYRALLVYNRLIHHRGDGAFIRVAAVIPDATGAEATVDQAMAFIQAFYPEIMRSLPL